jgi:hypothetical protein
MALWLFLVSSTSARQPGSGTRIYLASIAPPLAAHLQRDRCGRHVPCICDREGQQLGMAAVAAVAVPVNGLILTLIPALYGAGGPVFSSPSSCAEALQPPGHWHG